MGWDFLRLHSLESSKFSLVVQHKPLKKTATVYDTFYEIVSLRDGYVE